MPDAGARRAAEDPANGVKNVTGDVCGQLRAHDVGCPYPQRVIRFRELPPELARPARARAAE